MAYGVKKLKIGWLEYGLTPDFTKYGPTTDTHRPVATFFAFLRRVPFG